MRSFIVLALFVAAAVAIPVDKDTTILRYDNDNIGVEGFNFGYETSDGTSHQESGQLLNAGKENEGIAVQGSYRYVGPDGVTYQVDFVADQNGFQPQGAHLPKSP